MSNATTLLRVETGRQHLVGPVSSSRLRMYSRSAIVARVSPTVGARLRVAEALHILYFPEQF